MRFALFPTPRKSTFIGTSRAWWLAATVSAGTPAREIGGSDPLSADLRGARILVVEDDTQSAKLLFATLAVAWAVVQVAENAAHALAIVPLFEPQIILIDLVLPGLGGLGLAQRLKAWPSTRGVPLVAITAYDGEGVRRLVEEAGFTAFLRKPIDVATLPGLLRRLLDGSNWEPVS